MRYFIAFILLFSGLILSAQKQETEDSKVKAYRQVKELKSGLLIFRLPSENRKIEAYKNKYSGKMDSIVLANLIKDVVNARDTVNISFMKAFRQAWTFCPVLFIYDHETPRVLGHEKSGFFLDSNLVVNKSIVLEDKPYYFAEFTQLENGLECVAILDSKLNLLQNPFPYFRKVNDIMRLIFAPLNPKASVKRSSFKTIKAWNAKVFKFYRKAYLSSERDKFE